MQIGPSGVTVHPTGDRSYPPWNHLPPLGDTGRELSAVDSRPIFISKCTSHNFPMKVRSKTLSPLWQKSFFTFLWGGGRPTLTRPHPLDAIDTPAALLIARGQIKVAISQRHHHGRRLSVGDRAFLIAFAPVSGTNYHVTSRHVCTVSTAFTAVVLRLNFSAVLFWVSVVPLKWHLPLSDILNRRFYLLT